MYVELGILLLIAFLVGNFDYYRKNSSFVSAEVVLVHNFEHFQGAVVYKYTLNSIELSFIDI